MELLILFGAGLLFIIMRIFYDQKEGKNKLRLKLKQQFGQVPTWEYSQEKYESIQKYYNSKKDEKKDVDDITWNDVDMDDIFMLMNNTCTSMGEEVLYCTLRKLNYQPERLQKIDELAEYFLKHDEKRLNLQMVLTDIGRTNKISVYEYINSLENLKEESITKHVLQAIGLIFSIVMIPFFTVLAVLATIAMIAYNLFSYYKSKANMEAYLNIIAYIARMLSHVQDLTKVDCPVIDPIVKEIAASAKNFKEFKRGSKIISGGGSGSLADIILDYFRILLHIDIISFYRLLKIFKKHQTELTSMYENIGFIDMCIAVASFRRLIPYYCKPELSVDKKPYLRAKELYHVMIQNPVVNSIEENRSVLITGSNASGKSTFIKTLAINAILSQTVYTSLSKEYSASYFMVASSMALRDDIFSKESYYIVEIKSLKRIMDRLNGQYPVLCFVDEILRGTNTLERIAASSRILYSLAKSNAICFAATHDIELTHILEDAYSNYHFQEQIVDNNILFDYKLYEGKAVSKNAIKLLSIMGYSNDIINQATNAANHFLKAGEWEKI